MLPPTILFVGFNLILWATRPILEEHGGDFGGFFTFPSARRAGQHRAPARFAARRGVSTRLAHTMSLRHPPTTAKAAASFAARESAVGTSRPSRSEPWQRT